MKLCKVRKPGGLSPAEIEILKDFKATVNAEGEAEVSTVSRFVGLVLTLHEIKSPVRVVLRSGDK